jgi:hypothetical protein
MTKRIIPIFTLFCLLSVAAFADEVRLSQFLAGYEMLKGATRLGDQERKIKLAGLERTTGLTARMVAAMVRNYKGDPEGWSKIQMKVADLLNRMKEE